LLTEAALKIWVGYVSETKAEVCALVDALNQEDFEGLGKILLPEVHHGLSCSLWQYPLINYLLPELFSVLEVNLISDDLVQLYTLDY
jgi:hypothetical protein